VIAAIFPHWMPSLLVCVALVTIGGFMIRGHLRSWAERQAQGIADPADLLHYYGQYRRRIQTSALIIIIGILIFVGDVISEQIGPKLFGWYWVVVLILVCYLILLAVLDGLSTASHTRAALARLRAQRRQLERHAAELKERPFGE
jgi:small-conductance mechanosensitive channel